MDAYYPVYLNLDGKKCLVVGGGKVAERKVKNLLGCGATVYVVSPEFTEWLGNAADEGLITVIKRNYATTDLEDSFLVIGATADDRTNTRVANDCDDRNIPVNIVDNHDLCSFIVPAVVRQGPLSISISTDGKSPMLARRIKEELESSFGDEYRQFLEIIGDVREYIINTVPEQSKRREIFHQLVYSDILELLREGKHEMVKERITHVLGCGWPKS